MLLLEPHIPQPILSFHYLSGARDDFCLKMAHRQRSGEVKLPGPAGREAVPLVPFTGSQLGLLGGQFRPEAEKEQEVPLKSGAAVCEQADS